MIMPTIRASFGRRDALHLVELLGRDDPELRDAARRRLEEAGMDSLLDDPRVRAALLTDGTASASPELVFYVLVRQALLEVGVEDRSTADFVASLVFAFGRGGRAYRVSEASDEEYHYLVDMMMKLASARDREAFLLRSHLGNYSLWIAGLFPDFVDGRRRRRGAPGVGYYEQVGRTGYRMAARTTEAASLGVEEIFDSVATDFSAVRTALNRVSDRYLWPRAGDPIGRLFREVSGRPPS